MQCEWCHKEIDGEGKRFCCRPCYLEWVKHYGKHGNMRAVCKQCGAEFKKAPNEPNSIFCSQPCYLQYRAQHPEQYSTKRKITLNCEQCGAEFEKGYSAYLETNHHYCGRTCANRARSEALKRVPEMASQKGVETVCQHCGVTFYVKYHQKGKRKYCSRACTAAARFGTESHKHTHDTSGANNPNYKGTNNRTTAKQVYFRYMPKRCLVCGWDIVVDVHHITPRRHEGTNDLTNLIGLCPNHHRMADLGMIEREELTRLVLAAIAELPDHLRPSGLPQSIQPGNGRLEPLFAQSELPNPSD
jgi:hypothetical protein